MLIYYDIRFLVVIFWEHKLCGSKKKKEEVKPNLVELFSILYIIYYTYVYKYVGVCIYLQRLNAFKKDDFLVNFFHTVFNIHLFHIVTNHKRDEASMMENIQRHIHTHRHNISIIIRNIFVIDIIQWIKRSCGSFRFFNS